MKTKLTLQFLFWNVIIIFFIQFVFMGVNLLGLYKGFAFSKNFYNFNFNTSEISDKYKNKIINSKKGFQLTKSDIKVLKDNGIWLQILDDSNKEINNINKPKEIPKEYLTGDAMRYANNAYAMPKASTIHADTFIKAGKKYSLILGFPTEKIWRYTFSFTAESMKFYMSLIFLNFILIILAGYLFSRRLASPVADIIDNIKIISKGKYKVKNINKFGIYEEVNENLKNLASIIKENEEERKSTEKMKEQWIANIAHDLKTPLSSINGYSQFLTSEDYELQDKDVKRYGQIVKDKTEYIQALIEDLSLIYKFKNKVVPLEKKRENIVEVVREIIIDILNNPLYGDRNINIHYASEDIYLNCDKKYIKRVFNNFIMNSIVHNPKDTEITIDIKEGVKSEVIIEIRDNGNGIREEELKSLFNRYYRATNTGESHKGSGLGMAIGKEIINMHNGEIEAFSRLSEGTSIVMSFNTSS
ncbi:sensor histidine kinase [Clostridium felsineum]|uniref:sensor histidine kinase n=1 Tax=Clostridium felsineum TaxID=36839 RepID=UPI00098CA91A|nr:HAMP domain-containing sensor histidine kinase [Clostridium felsineum]